MSPDAGERRSAIRALAEVPEPSEHLVAAVVERLGDAGLEMVPSGLAGPPFVYAVADEAVTTLLRWGAHASVALPRLAAMLGSDGAPAPPRVRARAMKVAAGLGDAGLAQVVTVLSDPDPSAREAALRALARGLRADRREHTGALVQVLGSLLDEDTSVVFAADETLRALGNGWVADGEPAQALAAAIRAFLAAQPRAVHVMATRAASADTRFTAVRALGHLVGRTDAGEALARIVRTTRGGELELAAESLVRVGPVLSQVTVEALCSRLEECPRPAIWLTRVLAMYGDRARAAVPRLVSWLTRVPAAVFDRPVVRTNQLDVVVDALAAIAPQGNPNRDALLAVLR
ncbi:MAG: hypothetical protein IT379_29745 [Deltaproteobacteria bacterium]|nr:hypothetical protein [Deltaproteobacteria bacterium]